MAVACLKIEPDQIGINNHLIMDPKKIFDLTGKKVWVAGHNGMVGSAIVRRLYREDCETITVDRAQLDLTRQSEVESWMQEKRPEVIFLAAAKVGGIHANNTYAAEFIYENLAIETNIIHSAWLCEVKKLLFLGSSCIYPRETAQPIKEEALLTGPLEPTNEWYAIAKIAGIKLCQAYRKQHGCDFISAMPTNVFGPGDNFHPENSHVPAALLRRFHEAKIQGKPQEIVWGSGKPHREFIYVDDLADACVFLMQYYSGHQHINVGTGKDITIAEFAELVRKIVGFEGQLIFDTSRPDGMPRKLLDISGLIEMGWSISTNLEDGLKKYYTWFCENVAESN